MNMTRTNKLFTRIRNWLNPAPPPAPGYYKTRGGWRRVYQCTNCNALVKPMSDFVCPSCGSSSFNKQVARKLAYYHYSYYDNYGHWDKTVGWELLDTTKTGDLK